VGKKGHGAPPTGNDPVRPPGRPRASTAVRPRAAGGDRPGGHASRTTDPATSAPPEAACLTREGKLLTARACAVTVRACSGSGDGAGTSPIGRRRTRDGTFPGVGALGEMDPRLTTTPIMSAPGMTAKEDERDTGA
jgi:hypothetical protein